MTMLFHGTVAACAHEHLAAGAGAGSILSVLLVTQKSAWHLAHRIRETWDRDGGLFGGPVEIDETYIGGKRLRYQDLISGNGLESGARSMSI